jgi:hypothetical protein
MKLKLLIVMAVLLVLGGIVVAQTMKRGGGEISINQNGQVTVKARGGQNVNITGSTAAITGAATVSSTLGVTGVTTMTGGAVVGSGGATVAKVLTGTGSVDFTALAAGTCENFTITVTGAANGDAVFLGIPAAAWATTEYATIQGFVSTTNTVTVKRCNLTNATTALSDPAAVTIRAAVVQF